MATNGQPTVTELHDTGEIPSYMDFFNKTLISMNEFAWDWQKYPHEFNFTIRMIRSIRTLEIVYVLLGAVLFTIMREVMSRGVFIPFVKWFQLPKSDAEKLPESAWKFLVYTNLWLYSLYIVVLSGKYEFFFKPCTIWQNVVFDAEYWAHYFEHPIPADIQFMYVLQISFYIHSIYATACLDTWRKDSAVLIFHHILTIFLLSFSYLMHYHLIGALVLFLHDISDILLELTKVNLYMKKRGGVMHKVNKFISDASFIAFTVSWAWFRLYWYPLKVLHSTNWCVYVNHRNKDPKMYLFFNTMLWILLGLHIYWFYFVVALLVRILTGKMREIEDIREEEEANKQKPE